MKWFKHFSDAKSDTKIRRLIKKFGIIGYGLYWAVVESIAYQLTSDKPIPDIEENSQDIADMFTCESHCLTPEKVNTILLFCLNEGLFEQSEETGRILCMKILQHVYI